jgi:hypothetical protein
VTLKVAEGQNRVVLLVELGTGPPPAPRLVGRTYRNAYRSARDNGIGLLVTRVRPLRAAASADGIDSFVVVSQRRVSDYSISVELGERPCWKTVVQDWLVDTRIDGVYARRCYRETLRRLPVDVRGDLPRLLRDRLR